MYVCCCMGVNDKAIKAAVAEGATTVEAVTELTCAGSDCGSCHPEIAAIIEAELSRGCPAAGRPAVEHRHLPVVGSDAAFGSAADVRSDRQSAA